MDRTDNRILKILQHDGRISNQALADQMGISTAACWRRVRALEEEGLITGYAAMLDRTKGQPQSLRLRAYHPDKAP